MFSEVSVCSKGVEQTPPLSLEVDLPQDADTPLDADSPLETDPLFLKADPCPKADPPSCVLTSSGGHCSGQYASYWNAFLFKNSCWQVNVFSYHAFCFPTSLSQTLHYITVEILPISFQLCHQKITIFCENLHWMHCWIYGQRKRVFPCTDPDFFYQVQSRVLQELLLLQVQKMLLKMQRDFRHLFFKYRATLFIT